METWKSISSRHQAFGNKIKDCFDWYDDLGSAVNWKGRLWPWSSAFMLFCQFVRTATNGQIIGISVTFKSVTIIFLLLMLLLLLSRFSHVWLCATPHRQQPTRLRHPWDYPGKNTWRGLPFPSPMHEVKSEREVAQSCPTLHDHGLQPTRLLRPWDFPGKSTGVGCHCLLPLYSWTLLKGPGQRCDNGDTVESLISG